MLFRAPCVRLLARVTRNIASSTKTNEKQLSKATFYEKELDKLELLTGKVKDSMLLQPLESSRGAVFSVFLHGVPS